ncbi:MAG: tetratricopeptide repeat protein [Myxococcota bacterium]
MTAPQLVFAIRSHLQWTVSALLLATVVACSPTDPLQSVREQHSTGQYEASLEPLRELLAARPNDPEVQYRYGRALRELGELSMAQWALMRALEHPDWERPAAFELGALNLQSGNWDQAIEAMDRILERYPQNLQALEFRANVRLRTKNQYAEALEDAARIVEIDPENENAQVIRTVALMGLKQIDEASVALSELAETFRESPSEALAARYCTARAMFEAVEERHDEAEKLFLECFGTYPGSDVTFSGLLDYYEASEQRHKIIPFLAKQVRQKPDAGAFRNELIARLEAANDFNAAEDLLLTAAAQASESERIVAWFELGRHYMVRGDYVSAVDTSLKVLEAVAEPTSFMLAYHAEALILAGRLDDALEVAKRIQVSHHRELVRGRVAYTRGDCETAVEHFDEALRLWPENAVVRYYSGRCAEVLGDFGRAINEYRYAMRSDALATDASIRLARILNAEGDDASVFHVVRTGGNNNSDVLDAALMVIGIESLARSGSLTGLHNSLEAIRTRVGAVSWAKVLAGATRGIAHRYGPQRAISFLTAQADLDLGEVENILLVDLLAELETAAGRPDEGTQRTARSLENAGAEAARIEIHAAALARNGAPPEEVLALYRRALALDPALPRSASALARSHGARGDPAAALAEIAAALAADGMSQDRVLLRERARWLGELGSDTEARGLLLDLLRDDPTDTEATLILADSYRKPGGDPQLARRYAEQAARFSAGRNSSPTPDPPPLVP